MVWNITPVYAAMIADLKAGSFGTKHYAIGLADDSVQLLKTKAIPDDVWAQITALRGDIVGGKLKVEPVWDAAAVRALMSDVVGDGAVSSARGARRAIPAGRGTMEP